MKTLWRNVFILIAFFAVAIWAIVPPEKKIGLGTDLAGGATLVYSVDVKPGESDVIPKVIQVVKERLDPDGVREISIIGLGGDRIEITMPLPNSRVKGLKKAFDDQVAKLATGSITVDELERVAAMPAEQRAQELKRLAAGSAERQTRLEQAFKAYDDAAKARIGLTASTSAYQTAADRLAAIAKTAAADDPAVKTISDAVAELKQKRDEHIRDVAAAELAYEGARDAALAQGLSPSDLQRAMNLSDKNVKISGENNTVVTLDSPRKRALDEIYKKYPDQKPIVDAAIEKWKVYEAERRGLDDPQDVVRILKGAGVLNFRITVDVGSMPDENALREQVKAGGPRASRSEEARWFKINKIENWIKSEKELESLKASASSFFSRMNYVVEEFKGEYYMLCWDRRGLRLTEKDGEWSLASAYQGSDQLGRPAIDFRMDARGGDKLGALTENNVGKFMAVLLDDEVYTAPRLQSRISNQGQITGNFSASEISYIIRVLSAGSLQAKLSSEPISQSVLGPSLGADNLKKSFETGVVAFALVASFMILYYFTSGFIAVLALIYNCILVVALMALNHTAFSIPAIAGVVLTFGQAVDANVLIYERMREELQLGHDLRTSVRLGFSRALSPIVDGNISNLIICIVLAFFGTEEIKGFAITLGIGVVTTLFTTLFLTRVIFTILIERFNWRKTSQLPMAVPFVQRMFSPHVDWMKHRWLFLGLLVAFLAGSAVVIYARGADLLGMEFRGGTGVTLTFKEVVTQDAKGESHIKLTTMDRAQVAERVKEVAREAAPGSPLRQLEEAQVIAINPESNGVTAHSFTIKTLVTDPKLIQSAIVGKFTDVLDVLQAVSFAGADLPADRAPAFPMISGRVGDAVDKPGKGGFAPDFDGGLVILLDNIKPRVTKAELDTRINATRHKQEFSDTSTHIWETRVLEGSDSGVSSAVILVRDPEIRYEDRHRWESELRDREWTLATVALTQSQTVASVQSFSPAIARTFATQGILCTVLSLLLLTIYVFVRFGTVRWAIAATVPLFADVIGIVGLIGVAQILYETPATQGFARSVGLLPFDLDLVQIAAILTIVGYSLNDKIIILDRIRENKGKLPYASYKCINDSINQTLSRTVITAGAHMITTIALYLFGGEPVRGFAYTFNLGVLLGTYTSIVSTPLVWSHRLDPSFKPGASDAASSSSPGGQGGGVFPSSNGDHAPRSSGAARPAAGGA